ncbi:MAG: Gfo/Idh/MocA family oxidoreductase [Opitutae bacterium]|nr:Gfo/Idh/MocA family oxidoreductase [Opitutae bacterium]MBT6958123.1 Gfo/Idh/MocA family oxidoreductase [Opitutae bacterium]
MPKVSIIGAGNWGKNLIKTFSELGSLESIVELNPSIREQMAQDYPNMRVLDNYETLLASEIDAVAIATPVSTHFSIARKFLEAGKDVFVEKPITMSVDETQQLVDIATSSGNVLMTGHLLLYQPAIKFIHDYINAGKLGQIYSLHLERKNLGTIRSVENVMWSLGVHDIAVMVYLLGSAPLKVTAHGHCGLQAGVEDSVYLNLRFKGDVLAHLHNSWLWHEKKRGTTVIGERGILHYDELAQTVTLHKKSFNSDLKVINEGEEILFSGAAQPLRVELEHFIHCIKTREIPRSGPVNALAVIEILEQAQIQLKQQ